MCVCVLVLSYTLTVCGEYRRCHDGDKPGAQRTQSLARSFIRESPETTRNTSEYTTGRRPKGPPLATAFSTAGKRPGWPLVSSGTRFCGRGWLYVLPPTKLPSNERPPWRNGGGGGVELTLQSFSVSVNYNHLLTRNFPGARCPSVPRARADHTHTNTTAGHGAEETPCLHHCVCVGASLPCGERVSDPACLHVVLARVTRTLGVLYLLRAARVKSQATTSPPPSHPRPPSSGSLNTRPRLAPVSSSVHQRLPLFSGRICLPRR